MPISRERRYYERMDLPKEAYFRDADAIISISSLENTNSRGDIDTPPVSATMSLVQYYTQRTEDVHTVRRGLLEEHECKLLAISDEYYNKYGCIPSSEQCEDMLINGIVKDPYAMYKSM